MHGQFAHVLIFCSSKNCDLEDCPLTTYMPSCVALTVRCIHLSTSMRSPKNCKQGKVHCQGRAPLSPPAASETSTRLDDQFAIVPARYISAYFMSHHKRTWQTNFTLENSAFPKYNTGVVVYTLTRSLVDHT